MTHLKLNMNILTEPIRQVSSSENSLLQEFFHHPLFHNPQPVHPFTSPSSNLKLPVKNTNPAQMVFADSSFQFNSGKSHVRVVSNQQINLFNNQNANLVNNQSINSVNHQIMNQVNQELFSLMNSRSSAFVIEPAVQAPSPLKEAFPSTSEKNCYGKRRRAEDKRQSERARRMEFTRNLERLKALVPGSSLEMNSTFKVLNSARIYCRFLQVLIL